MIYKKHKKNCQKLAKEYDLKIMRTDDLIFIDSLAFSCKTWEQLHMFLQGYIRGRKHV